MRDDSRSEESNDVPMQKNVPGAAADMTAALIIRQFRGDEWACYRDLRLRALAESPDAFGSTLARECTRPDHEWESRLSTGIASARDRPIVAWVGNEAAGLAWCRISESEPETAHLYQLWTAPEYRGRGAGRGLVEASIDWVRANGVRALALSVTCGDTAAARLYRRLGFTPVGDPRPLRPGSDLMEQEMLFLTDALGRP